MTLQHEAAHQILFNCGLHVRGGQNPTWLAEGLATQFEVPQSRTKHGGVRVNQVRYADFRDAFEVEPTAKRLPKDHARRAWELGPFRAATGTWSANRISSNAAMRI
jgi:hypothetical protein